MKKIVVYYSFDGNTREVAKHIAAKLKVKMAEIRTVKTYPDDLDVLLGLGKKETETGYIPQIHPFAVDFSKYDAIILGMPVWWRTFAPAVKSFMASIDWKGKVVYPFITNEGKVGHTPSDLKKALRGAMISPMISIKFDSEHRQITPAKEVNNWIMGIDEDGYDD